MAATQTPTGQLTTLLQTFLSNDNAARNAAEQQYHAGLAASPATVVQGLIAVLRTCPEASLRSMAAVLLRRIFDLMNTSAASKLDAAVLAQVKDALVNVLSQEPLSHIARRVALTIGQLAVTQFATWPSLLPTVLAMTRHTEPARRATAYETIGKLCEFAFKDLHPFGNDLLTQFQTGLTDGALEVQLAAVKAITSFVVFLDTAAELAAFARLLPGIMTVLKAAMDAGDELEAADVLKELVELSRDSPALFKSSITEIGSAMLAVAKNDTVGEDVRRLSTEFLVSLCEHGGVAVRKNKTIIEAVIPLALSLMAELEADAGWAGQPYNADSMGGDNPEDPESCAAMGVEAMYRLANALHGGVMLPVAFAHIPTGLKSANPAVRHACALAPGLIGDGCQRLMKQQLSVVLDMILPALADADFRVRHAVVTSLSFFANDFASKSYFQTKYHTRVLPALAATMTAASKNPMRLRCHAAQAVVQFCAPGKCPTKAIARHLDALLAGIVELLQSGLDWAQAQALQALSCVAMTAGGLFASRYATFMPGLKALVATAPATEEAKLLRGRAMECFALVGEAVGRQMFEADATAVLQALLAEQEAGRLPPSDTQTPFVLRTCSRIAGVLEEAFAKYLPVVLPPLLASATMEVDMSVRTAEEAGQGGGKEDEDNVSSATYEIRGIGKLRFSLNTTAMEVKLNAVRSLFQYAEDLQEVFLPHAPQVAAVLHPLTTFRYSPEIRLSACLALPRLLYSMVHGLRKQGADLAPARSFLGAVVQALVKALGTEINQDTRVGIVEALKDVAALCYESGGDGAPIITLTPADTEAVVTILCAQTARSQERRQQVAARYAAAGEMDEAAMETMHGELEMEVDLMEYVVDGMGYLMKVNGPAFLPLFTRVQEPVFGPLLAGGGHTNDFLRLNALCVFIDVIEWCGEPGLAYVPRILPTLASCVKSDTPQLRQCALYGVGIVAQLAPASLRSCASRFVSAILSVITADDARSEDNLSATENGISALGKLLRYVGADGGLDVARLMRTWLSALPLVEDEMEAKATYKLLCEFVSGGHPHIAGPADANIPQIVNIMATALVGVEGGDGDELVDTETCATMVSLLKSMHSSHGSAMGVAWGKLSAAQQSAVQSAMRASA